MNRQIGTKNSGIGLILMIALMLAYQVLLVRIGVDLSDDGMTDSTRWLMYTLNPLCAFASAVIAQRGCRDYSLFGERGLGYKVRHRGNSLSKVLLVLIMTVALLFTSSTILTYYTLGLEALGYDTSTTVMADFSGIKIIPALICVAVMPAIGEESLMRGSILAGLKKKGYIFAIVLCGIMFGIMHLNPLQLIHQSILGMILAYIVIVTGDIWLAILSHGFNNAISLVLQYIVGDTSTTTVETSEYFTSSMIMSSIIILAIGITVVYRCLKALTNIRLKERYSDIGIAYVPQGKGFGAIEGICAYLEEMPQMDEDFGLPRYEKKSHRVHLMLYVAICVCRVLLVTNTLSGFGIL